MHIRPKLEGMLPEKTTQRRKSSTLKGLTHTQQRSNIVHHTSILHVAGGTLRRCSMVSYAYTMGSLFNLIHVAHGSTINVSTYNSFLTNGMPIVRDILSKCGDISNGNPYVRVLFSKIHRATRTLGTKVGRYKSGNDGVDLGGSMLQLKDSVRKCFQGGKPCNTRALSDALEYANSVMEMLTQTTFTTSAPCYNVFPPKSFSQKDLGECINKLSRMLVDKYNSPEMSYSVSIMVGNAIEELGGTNLYGTNFGINLAGSMAEFRHLSLKCVENNNCNITLINSTLSYINDLVCSLPTTTSVPTTTAIPCTHVFRPEDLSYDHVRKFVGEFLGSLVRTHDSSEMTSNISSIIGDTIEKLGGTNWYGENFGINLVGSVADFRGRALECARNSNCNMTLVSSTLNHINSLICNQPATTDTPTTSVIDNITAMYENTSYSDTTINTLSSFVSETASANSTYSLTTDNPYFIEEENWITSNNGIYTLILCISAMMFLATLVLAISKLINRRRGKLDIKSSTENNASLETQL
ncbi:hypothetical protein [Candidatus Ichthyocystis sparus]|uniref:hypothetical protein n=1 Tax=Candidatus Ichthyocystis sparus TaxID=1561004 RepID=UPI0011464E5C|nr:hypothetical protein [Candidatus Ichthyocystis sparus]